MRIHSLRMTTEAGSGHPTSSLSAAEIVSALYFSVMHYDPANMDSFENDEFVLSKGHGSPILYAALAEAGVVPKEELTHLREFDSMLEGHPVPRIAGVRAATGSLGQGLSVGIGMATAMKLDQINRRVYVLLGDGEMAEGNVWEAMNLAPHLKLDNLVAIIDMNRLGQSDPTLYQWDSSAYAEKARAFGWETYEIDGHNISEILSTFEQAEKAGKPVMIVARTVKGKGVPFLENKEGMHGKAVGEDQIDEAIQAVEKARGEAVDYTPENFISANGGGRHTQPEYQIKTDYTRGQKEATRTGFGQALDKLGDQDDHIVALDGDVKGSSRTKFFFGDHPDRSIECYIDEQNMIAIATGLATRGKRPVAASFAAFLTRAFDQVRMAGYSDAKITISGSHTGVSIGQDGPSQMGLEDLAMMRSVHGSAVVCPSDAVSAEKLTAEAVAYDGISYVRTGRPKTEILYDNDAKFHIGGSAVLKSSQNDVATVVATGVPVAEALHAAEDLERDGINVRVIDCYSLKPVDRDTLIDAARDTKMVFTVEDHYRAGGLGETVAGVVAGYAPVEIRCVTKRPHSGSPDKLMAEQGIDRAGIAAMVRDKLEAVS